VVVGLAVEWLASRYAIRAETKFASGSWGRRRIVAPRLAEGRLIRDGGMAMRASTGRCVIRYRLYVCWWVMPPGEIPAPLAGRRHMSSRSRGLVRVHAFIVHEIERKEACHRPAVARCGDWCLASRASADRALEEVARVIWLRCGRTFMLGRDRRLRLARGNSTLSRSCLGGARLSGSIPRVCCSVRAPSLSRRGSD